MAGQGIVHTTQAGEGDAVIFGRESKLSPIDNILNLGAQKQKAKAQSALLKQKLSNDNQQTFHKQLQDIHSKVWSRDLPEIEEKINNVIKYTIDAQRNGVDPFSDVGAQAEIFGMLGNIQATAGASLNDKNSYESRMKEIAADQMKDKNYDLEASIKALDERYTGKKVADRALQPEFKPVFSKYSVIPALDKVMGDNVKEVFKSAKVYSDAGNTKDANAMLDAAKQPFIQTALQQAAPMIAIGRTTPEAVAQEASDYWDTQKKTALYDPLKVNTLELAKTKEANLQAYRNASLGLRRQALELAKKSKETTPTYAFDEIGRTITGGGSSAVFENTPYEDTDLGIPDGAGGYIYPIISKIEKSEVNPDKSITAVVTLKKPQLSKDEKSVEFVDHILKVPAFDKIGNPVYQNSKLYADIQKNAVKNNISYANISQQEVGSGKANITPTTANNQGGFFNPVKPPANTTPTNNIPLIKDKASFDALPKGTIYTKIDGKKYKK